MDEHLLKQYLPELADQIGAEHLPHLLARMRVRSMAVGDILFHDQAPIDAFHLVLSGRLRLHIEVAGHALRLGEVGPGNWCGELAYFSGIRRASSTVTAPVETVLARLSFDDFDALIAEDSVAVCRLTHAFIQMLIRRLEVTANNPVVDPQGRMLLLGDLSVPLDQLAHKRHGLVDFLKSLLGVRG
jgi:CRP-like cAMP-binding protein